MSTLALLRLARLAVLAMLGTLSARSVSARDDDGPRVSGNAMQAPHTRRKAILDGTVTDTMMRPLADAEVSVVGTTARVLSDANGRFRFEHVPGGVHVLTVRRVGYSPASSLVDIRDGDTLRLAFVLKRTTQMLDTMRVHAVQPSARLSDFETRRQQGTGQFITQQEIDRRGSVFASDLLRTLSGIRITPTSAGLLALSAREGGSTGGAGAGICEMQVMVDGRPMPRGYDLSLLPFPSEIAGIELYKGPATAPLEFGGPNRRCGVIAVWTRSGI